MQYIEKKAALDAIWQGCGACAEELEQLPVVEIVRCEECKHFDKDNAFCEGRGWPMQLVPEDGYCDRGEKDDRP